MRAKLSGQAKLCYQRAAVYRKRAENPKIHHIVRQELLAMEYHWLTIARSYETAEQVSSQLQWLAQRPDPDVDPHVGFDPHDNVVPFA
jgi:hypothetical protein